MRNPREPKPEVLSFRPFLDAFETLVRGGIPPSAFSPEVLSAVTRVRATQEFVTWDLFLDVMDQGRAAAGNDEAFTALFESFEGGKPETAAFEAPQVPVKTVIRAVWDSYGAGSFPHVANTHDELPDGRLELRLEVPEWFRDTSSFWLGCVGANRTLPCRVGAPPAQLEYECTPHRLVMRVLLTEKRRARKADDRGRTEALTEIIRVMRQNVERALDRTPAPRTSSKERVAALAQQWSLTPRQAEVLGCICRGLSNQEISNELGCARKTVELHVTELLRKSGLESRVQIVSLLLETDTSSSNDG